MQIRNSKSLFHFLTDLMDRLDKDEIANEKARVQSSLAGQVTKVLYYELDRVKTQIMVSHHNQNQNFKKLELREVESTNFDNTNK